MRGRRARPAVLACSALKQRYRDALGDGVPDLRIVHLAGSRELIAARLGGARQHRYMPASAARQPVRRAGAAVGGDRHRHRRAGGGGRRGGGGALRG
ncbi:MAG: hypothetical protein MZW92_81905 [Comamonadaceae bacterium]|nr:hypothetical protein [Comamonadaceae bacterium]